MMNIMVTNTLVSPEALAQMWKDLARDDQSPDHYELTEHGELVLSPKPTNRHQWICGEITFQLRTQLGGKASLEVAVQTKTAGIRVPDVVWVPDTMWQDNIAHQEPLIAPPLVVEVLSPGNRQPEMNHKIQGYLNSGVKEVMVIGLTGAIDYYRQDGVHPTSIYNLSLSLSSHLFQ